MKQLSDAFKHAHGQFKAKAQRAGMGTVAFARQVLRNKGRYSAKTVRQAVPVANMARARR